MTTFYTIPKGPLISFGSFAFTSGRSVLESGWGLASTAETIALVNNPTEADLAGFATLSQHGTYVWQYLIQGFGRTLKAAQDELTTLLTALRTQNVDGTTGQVALLTVGLLGYTGTVATGMARLVSVVGTESTPTYEKLSLTFLVPQGFSYTA